MYKNYLYLLRGIVELKSLLINEKIYEIYTQEKDKLFISIPLKDHDNFHLIISANAQHPYLTIKKVHHKAKKNLKYFFSEYLPDYINKIEIAFADRVIKFSLTNSSLFFLIRGPLTNVFLIDTNNNIYTFKKIDEKAKEEIFNEITQLRYIDSFEPVLNEITTYIDENISDKFRFIDKSILNELKLRSDTNIENIVKEICYDDIKITINRKENLIEFKPEKFYDNYNLIIGRYKKYIDAIQDYLSNLYSLKNEKSIYAEINKYLKNEIGRVTNKLNNLKARIENGSKETEYFSKGNLLIANISKIHKGMKNIEAVDFENNRIIIELDEKLSPQQNIDKYFEKAKSERVNYERSQKLYIHLLNYFNYLLQMKTKIESEITYEELQKIKDELKIKSKMDKTLDKEKINFRHFVIDNKYHLYVGKDSRNNDELTLKFAKQNDYWFHARSVSGSHAVLKVENPKEGIPKNILKKAASIAAFYSKAKTSKLAPVSYTLKKYVIKRKGMEPGQVSLLKEDVILVKPEIPSNCEIASEE